MYGEDKSKSRRAWFKYQPATARKAEPWVTTHQGCEIALEIQNLGSQIAMQEKNAIQHRSYFRRYVFKHLKASIRLARIVLQLHTVKRPSYLAK
jgi:hypothetical protein